MHQLDSIEALLQAKFENRVFMKLGSRYADYFPEYSSYFGRALRLLKSMCGMNKSEKLFADELIEWLIEAVFIQYQFQMSVYHKNAPYVTNIVVLYYVGNFVYWYKYETLVKWFVYYLRKRLHVKFLGYAHWFISISISQIKDHYISVDQAIYDTFIVDNYLDTTKFKTSNC